MGSRVAGLLLSPTAQELYGERIARAAGEGGIAIEPILVPIEEGRTLGPDELARIEIAFLSGDLFRNGLRSFFGSVNRAPNLRWMHTTSAGTDNPVFVQLIERGVQLSNSSGSSAEPIAQTAIAGMLMLARGFVPHHRASQDEKIWRDLPYVPRDVAGQTMTVLGPGAIGNAIARIARAIGMHVVGVRRSPLREGDHLDELVTPGELLPTAARTDWLVVACPLTEETRGMVSREVLARLPKGASIVNIARGAIIDEPALIEALDSGHLAGAYLDVFAEEPLPPESRLWAMRNVIVTPHSSAISDGNYGRAAAIFVENLGRYGRGEPLVNEVKS